MFQLILRGVEAPHGGQSEGVSEVDPPPPHQEQKEPETIQKPFLSIQVICARSARFIPSPPDPRCLGLRA
jgi:hypothetical protein